MSTTVVDLAPRDAGVSCTLSGELIVPRLVRRHGRTVEVALVAGRAVLLPGDEVRLRIVVGAGCALRLVDVGGLVVYGRPDAGEEPSQWHAHLDLAADAHLVWEGLPTVITDAGSLTRSLSLSLGRAAAASLRETLVLGRSGERGGRLRAETDVSDAAGPILRETLEVDGVAPVPGVLGAHRVMDSVLAFGEHVDLADVPGAVRLELLRGGTMLRYLGDAAHRSPLVDVALPALAHEREPAHVG